MNKIPKKQPIQRMWCLPLIWPALAMGIVVALQLGLTEHVKGAALPPEVIQSEQQTNTQPAAARTLYIPAVQNKGNGSQPTATPSVTVVPTGEPTNEPTDVPTAVPTENPTEQPTESPTVPPTATPTATSEPTPERMGAGVFVEEEWKVNSSSLAVDAHGGMHLAYVYYEPQQRPDPDDDNPTAAVYIYCPTDCDLQSNWKKVMLGDQVSEVQIGLTPLGQPRLLLLARTQVEWGNADQYFYAECDENCTKLAGWRVGAVITSANDLSWNPDPDFQNREDEPKHSFALDPQGRPRFIHYHYNVEHALATIGAYYAACDEKCTESANWTHTLITQVYEQLGTWYWEELYNPALAFTSTGQPRLVAALKTTGFLPTLGIDYFACDGECDNIESWQSMLIEPVVSAGPPDWDLEIDANDQPHVALYVWPANIGRNELEYGWCGETNCLELSAWQFVGVRESDGRDPDLELNAEGQPRIAYLADESLDTASDYSSLFYGWCDANCQSPQSTWTHSRVENGRNIIAEWQGGYPAAVCEGGFAGGGVPSLALDDTGAPRIAYDTRYYGPCEYDADADSWQVAEFESLVWQSVRAVIFPQP